MSDRHDYIRTIYGRHTHTAAAADDDDDNEDDNDDDDTLIFYSIDRLLIGKLAGAIFSDPKSTRHGKQIAMTSNWYAQRPIECLTNEE